MPATTESSDTPPQTPPPNAKPAIAADTGFMSRILSDLGKVIEGGELKDAPPPASDPPRDPLGKPFVMLGDAAKLKAERDALASQPATPSTPPETASEPPEKPPIERSGEAKPTETPPSAPSPVLPAKPKVEIVKERSVDEIVEGVVRRIEAERSRTPAESPKPKEQETPAEEDAYAAQLDEEQKEELELAKFAAKQMPARYGQMPKLLLDYLRKVDRHIESKRAGDADWNPDEDEQFAALIENERPQYEGADRRKLERLQIKELTKAELEAELKPALDETRREQRAISMAPELDRLSNDLQHASAARFAPDEKAPLAQVVQKAKAKGFTSDAWKEAASEDGPAARIAQRYMAMLKQYQDEYLGLRYGVRKIVQYDPKQPADSPQNVAAARQAMLFSFIDKREAEFAGDPNASKIIDGKSFVTRARYQSMPEPERAAHWTITDADVLDLLAVQAAMMANNEHKVFMEQLKADGYVRPQKQDVPKSEEQSVSKKDKPDESPKSKTTPAPGPAEGAQPPKAQALMSLDELNKLQTQGAKMWV